MGTLGGSRRGCRLDRGQAVVELLESFRDLTPELVHRRVEARRIQQLGEPAGVAIEVGPQQGADSTDGAVSLGLVEQLVDERAQRPAVAQELLEGSRQAAVTVREIRAQSLLESRCGLLVGSLRLAQQAVELAAHGVDVDGDAGILESDEPDLDGAVEQAGPLRLGALRDERGQSGIVHDQTLQDDAITIDSDREPFGSRERDDATRFHEPHLIGGACQLACHASAMSSAASRSRALSPATANRGLDQPVGLASRHEDFALVGESERLQVDQPVMQVRHAQADLGNLSVRLQDRAADNPDRGLYRRAGVLGKCLEQRLRDGFEAAVEVGLIGAPPVVPARAYLRGHQSVGGFSEGREAIPREPDECRLRGLHHRQLFDPGREPRTAVAGGHDSEAGR